MSRPNRKGYSITGASATKGASYLFLEKNSSLQICLLDNNIFLVHIATILTLMCTHHIIPACLCICGVITISYFPCQQHINFHSPFYLMTFNT